MKIQGSLITITEYKKLRVEIDQDTYLLLEKQAKEGFKKPFWVSKSNKFYAEITLNSWQKSDKSLFQYSQLTNIKADVKIEFYEKPPYKSMILKLVCLN